MEVRFFCSNPLSYLNQRNFKHRYVPPDSTIIYISHEWVGTSHPDPDGTQMYHLLLVFERLRNGDIARTEMDWIHTMYYKQGFVTSTQEWKRLLSSEKTFIFYDGFCVPKSRQEDWIRSIPAYVRRCDFSIVLCPGLTHFDRIDPRTKRKINLCYRTYRRRARCVFEMFSAFLSTKRDENAMPMLLIRSSKGTGYNSVLWISVFECQKLSVREMFSLYFDSLL